MNPLDPFGPGVLGTEYETQDDDGDDLEVSIHVVGHHDPETGTTRVLHLNTLAEPPVTAVLFDSDGCVVAIARAMNYDRVLELLDAMDLSVPVA